MKKRGDADKSRSDHLEDHDKLSSETSRLNKNSPCDPGLLQTILSTTSCLIACLDANFNYIYVNQAFAKINGGRTADLVGCNHFDLNPCAQTRQLFEEVVKHGRPCFNSADDKICRLQRQGEPCFFEWSLVPVKSAPDRVDQLVLSALEVARLRQENAELRQFKTIADKANCGVTIVTDKGVVQYVNECMAQSHGFKTQSLLGQHLSVFHSQDQMPVVESILAEVQEKGECGVREVWHRHQNGQTFPMLMSVIRVTGEQGAPYVAATAIEITNLKLLEQQLRRLESLASTGRLAASVAHEANSPLQAVLFILNRLEGLQGNDQRLAGETALLKEAFEAIRRTNNSLMDLNRPSQENRQLVHVNAIVRKTASLVEAWLKKNKVLLDLALSPDLPPVLAFPQDLSQTLLNLYNNALEAFSEPVRVYPEYDPSDPPKARWISVSSWQEAGWIYVEVADNGPGIEKEHLPYLFDPFYTSKEKEGMGIGLTRSRQLIENNGGRITARNGATEGAVFSIALPACEKSADVPPGGN